MESPLNLAGESAGRGRRPVGSGDDAAFDQSGGVHSTGLVVVDGPLGTTGIYGRYGGHLDSDGGVVDALHPSADGGGADATAVVREGSTFTLPLSAAPGAGNYPLTGQTVDWGDGQPDATPTASDTSASHQYTDGGDTDTAQAYAVYGSGTATKSVPANPVAVQVVDVPARLTAVELDGENGDGEVPAGGTAELSAAFTDPGLGEHHQATVDWGDGTTSAATVYDSGTGRGGIDATHVYADSGSYTATLTVTDDAGGTPGDGLSRATVPLDVTYVAPTFGLTAAPTATAGGAGVSLTLRAAGTNAGGVTGWSVDWGDGTTPTVVPGGGVAAGNRYTWPVPPHVYAAAGHYVISATPADQAGPHAAAVGTTVSVAEPAPTNLTATAVDDEDVRLTWTPDRAAGTQYEVDRQNPDGTWAAIATVDDSVEGDTYTDSGLSGLQTYAYRVRAVGGTPDLNSAYTAPASATTTLTTPNAPTGVSATESNLGEVDLTWAEDSTIVTGYIVTATPLGGGTPITSTVDGYASGAAVTGLTPDESYSFAVVADNNQGDGNDVRSAPSAAITAVGPAATLSATVPATVNEGDALPLVFVAAAPAGTGSPIVSLRVTWTDGAVQSFPTYTAGSTLTDTYTLPATAQSDSATVVATDAAGHTFVLPPVDADVVPTAPTDVTTTIVSGIEVDLSWTAPSQSATGYEVLRADAGSTDYEDVADLPVGRDPQSDTMSYQDTTLTPGTQYAYEVTSTGGTYTPTASTPTPSPDPVTTPAQELTISATPDADAIKSGNVQLIWAYQGEPEQGFEVELEDQTTGENYHDIPSDMESGLPESVVAAANGTGGETVSGLTSGDDYQFRIRADLVNGTATDYAGTSLAIPSLVAPSISAGGDGSLDINFAAGNATGFQYESQGGAEPGPGWWYPNPSTYPFESDIRPGELTPSGGTFVGGVAFLPGDVVRVRAETAAGFTLWSEPATMPAKGDPSIPKAGFTATVVSSTEIDVTVDNASDGYELHYDDLLSSQGEQNDQIASKSSGDANASGVIALTGLSAGTAYYLSVAAFGDGNSSGLGPWSAAQEKTTPGGPAPAAPDLLSATLDAKNGEKINLHWHNTPGNETGYEILRAFGNGPFTPYVDTAPDVTDYTDVLPGTQSPGQARTYEVVALGPGNTRSAPTTSQPVYQPYAPSYELGADPQGIRQIDELRSGYSWHRLLILRDFDLGVIIQHITLTYTYSNKNGLRQLYTPSYWEAILPHEGQAAVGYPPVIILEPVADDYWTLTAIRNVKTVTETGESIYYPNGAVPPSFGGGILESHGYPATINFAFPSYVPPLKQSITWSRFPQPHSDPPKTT